MQLRIYTLLKISLFTKVALALLLVAPANTIHAQGFRITDQAMTDGFVNLPVVMVDTFHQFFLDSDKQPGSIKNICQQIANFYTPLKWNPDTYGCGKNGIPWKSQLKSHGGSPLIYAEFGQGSNTSLILGGVHPDELTPIPLVFRLANHLQANPNLIPEGSRVIIAPLVNPDGFFQKTAVRTNLRGVDLNRNFFTRDWYSSARRWWAERRQKNPRHFPGPIPNSEIETMFQIWLVDAFKPDKIISLHAPLGFYDYDGPTEQKHRALTTSEEKAKTLVQKMSASSKNYKIVDYSFYPGSLGNYAGNERGIPTVTLELETTNPAKVDEYWAQFSPGLEHAIKYPFVNSAIPKRSGSSLFLESYRKQNSHGTAASSSNPRL
jgi:protein MpaA